MPNHVHAILYKINLPLFRILQTIKTFTAKQANAVLKRHGEHFWQRETYDHLIRSRKEFDRQVVYVLENPVKARLVGVWEDWPFSWRNAECNAVW
jgi:REP element-mobilizing transposase RayT